MSRFGFSGSCEIRALMGVFILDMVLQCLALFHHVKLFSVSTSDGNITPVNMMGALILEQTIPLISIQC